MNDSLPAAGAASLIGTRCQSLFGLGISRKSGAVMALSLLFDAATMLRLPSPKGRSRSSRCASLAGLIVLGFVLLLAAIQVGLAGQPPSISAYGSGVAASCVGAFVAGCSSAPGCTSNTRDLFHDRRRLTSCSPKGRRRGPRSKAEVEKERREKWEKTTREIDELVAEYHGKISRNQAKAVGTVYARYSTRFQDSIADQLRQILEYALKVGVYVPREFVFFDLAVRGFKKQRLGLDQMQSVLKRKEASVLLLFSTSRLFRKTYRTLEFVDNVHEGLGTRCIFVKSGVDTDDKERWRMLLAMHSMMDQFVVTMYVANIQAAHEGLLAKRVVFGTLSFGYGGEEIPGEFTKRKRPRCKIVIDEETSAIVVKIFTWYVEERLSITEIVGRLNDDESIPLPPRSTTGMWTRLAVKRVLTNPRYRGLWQYGVKETIYLPAQDYLLQRMRAEPLSEIQIEELRIVSDATWFAAQERLAKQGSNGGRRSKDGDRKSRPKLLNGMLICPAHDQALYVSGSKGYQMNCPVCHRLPAAKRALYSQLNRKLALQMICEKLADLVRGDAQLVKDIIAACQLEADAAQQPDPTQLVELRAQDEKLKRSIEFTFRNLGETTEEQAEAEKVLKELRAERSGIAAKVSLLEAARSHQPKLPTEEEVRQLIAHLGDILVSATQGDDDGNRGVIRNIIELLTGGRIELYQMGERQPQRGWLQGQFRVRLLPYLVEQATGLPASCTDDAIDVVIDFKRPAAFDEEAEYAWQLYKDGKLGREIAQLLECSRSNVTKLLKYAADKHGEMLPDGRSRRATLSQKLVKPPLYKRLADPAMELWDTGLSIDAIAAALSSTSERIKKAISWWHESRGLPVPDGRGRANKLRRKDANSNNDGGQLAAG